MNELITKIYNNKPMLWRIFFIFLDAFLSFLCSVITRNILITILFIIGTALMDISIEIHIYLNLEEWIIQVIRGKGKYLFFAFWALLPTIGGKISGEIDILDNFPSMLFANLVPNILGTCIVCSIIDHISKFGYEQNVYSLIQSKKGLLNIFIHVTYFGCFINAANYYINDKWKCTNILNSMYLFIIIFCGAIAVFSFVSRIISKQKFDCTAEEVYPSKTLFWAAVFLISCGAGPIFFGIEKHEPILLLMNSITAFMMAMFLLAYIIHRTENKSKTYPFKQIIGFFVLVGANCLFNFYKWDKTGDILQQFYSGIAIFVFAVVLLLYIYSLQKRDNHSILKKKDLESGMIVILNNGFLYMVILNTDMNISECNDYGILLGISEDGSVKQNNCLRLLDYNDDLETADEDFNVFEVYSTDRVAQIGQISNYNCIWRRKKILLKAEKES